MKKTMKKVLASAMAGALSVAGVGLLPAATANAEGAVAHLNINNADWSGFEAEYVDAEITGDGQYTVSMTAATAQSLAQFNALEVADGEALLGTACIITVDSIKINGTEATLTGPSYTCSADGGGATTRVNLYNEWNAPDETATAGDDNHADHRTASASLADCTATLVDYSLLSAVETLEVTFTVSNYGVQAAAGESAAAPVVEGPVFAHLNINNADWSAFDAEYVDAEITGDGQYTVSMTAATAQALAQFNALEVENGEFVLGTGSIITIDSIKINGEEKTLNGPSYTCSADGGAATTRVNLYNEWNAPDETATAGDDNHLDHRTAAASLADCTATLVNYEDLSAVESIEVTFTVSNFGVGAAAGEATEVAGVDLNGEYNAYIGIQTPTYSFRNAWNDGTYGLGTEYFNQITGWDADNNAVTRQGTINDTKITGNGTYTVSITDMDLAGDFDSQDHFNLIFFSTDIPNSGEITISDVVLKVDGSKVDIAPILSEEDEDYMQMQIQNIWNGDISEVGYYNVPPTSIEITFTVSGFDYDNTAAAEEVTTTPAATGTDGAAAPTTEETKTEGGNKALPFILGGAGVVVCGGAAAFVASKKKKN